MACEFWTNLVKAKCETAVDVVPAGIAEFVFKQGNVLAAVEGLRGLVRSASGSFYSWAWRSPSTSETIIAEIGVDGSVISTALTNANGNTGARWLVGDRSNQYTVGYIRDLTLGYPPSEIRVYPTTASSGGYSWPGLPISSVDQYSAWYPSGYYGGVIFLESGFFDSPTASIIYAVDTGGGFLYSVSQSDLIAVVDGAPTHGSVFLNGLSFSTDGLRVLLLSNQYTPSAGIVYELSLATPGDLRTATGGSFVDLGWRPGGGIEYKADESGFVVAGTSSIEEWAAP